MNAFDLVERVKHIRRYLAVGFVVRYKQIFHASGTLGCENSQRPSARDKTRSPGDLVHDYTDHAAFFDSRFPIQSYFALYLRAHARA